MTAIRYLVASTAIYSCVYVPFTPQFHQPLSCLLLQNAPGQVIIQILSGKFVVYAHDIHTTISQLKLCIETREGIPFNILTLCCLVLLLCI